MKANRGAACAVPVVYCSPKWVYYRAPLQRQDQTILCLTVDRCPSCKFRGACPSFIPQPGHHSVHLVSDHWQGALRSLFEDLVHSFASARRHFEKFRACLSCVFFSHICGRAAISLGRQSLPMRVLCIRTSPNFSSLVTVTLVGSDDQANIARAKRLQLSNPALHDLERGFRC